MVFVTGSPSSGSPHFLECEAAARDAYLEAGVTDPRSQLALAEERDCYTPTEPVLMEDLRFADRGTAWKELLAGTFELTGELPVNSDGGLKGFGHAVGASGLRMFFECWLQLVEKHHPIDRFTLIGLWR
jgi:acetyl-CoA C-acetyltransferase